MLNAVPSVFDDEELCMSPAFLPCGRVIPNRFVKVAMYEHLATLFGGPPNEYHMSLYARWAQGGWGIIITGNCQISPTHLSLGRDIVCSPDSTRNFDTFKALAAAMHSCNTQSTENGTLAIMQLSHSGRQSPRIIGGRLGTLQRPLGPSDRRVGDDTKEGWIARIAYKLMFQTPRAILLNEIEDIVTGFVEAAKTVHQAGFDGVQLHASHGYLLAQFLSPKLNKRKDKYFENLLLIKRIICEIRAVVPSRFVLGVKMNAGDYVTGGLSEEQALDHIRQIALLGVDFIEISGGDYENPKFMASVSSRQAFFSSFSRLAVQAIPRSANNSGPLIMLTGAIRTPSQFSQILRQKHAHLLGIGRLSILCPDLPCLISSGLPKRDNGIDSIVPVPIIRSPYWFPKLIGAGVETAWYVVGIKSLASGKAINMNMSSVEALFWMWFWNVGHNMTKVMLICIMGSLSLFWLLYCAINMIM